jgi:Mg-chelatase subunit ChlD/predicted lipid-binding transport protein (Tim44 family)
MPVSLSFPRLVLFGLSGIVSALLVALTFGELTWWLLRPTAPESVPPPHEAYTAPVKNNPFKNTPGVRLAVSASPRVSVYPGNRNTVRTRIARENFDGPVAVKLFSHVAGFNGCEVTIPAGETSAEVEFSAANSVKPGTHALIVTATTLEHIVTATTTAEVTVLATPAPPPRLAVNVSARVQVHQRGMNTFAVRIARGEFDGDVTVSFQTPEGVTVPAVTIAAGKTEATAELLAEGAKPGVFPFTVSARAAPTSTVISAETRGEVEVFASPRLPADVVFVLDCTGSMKGTVARFRNSIPRFTGEFPKAQLEPQVGLVGFQDTTLGQRLQFIRVGGAKLTADFDQFRTEVGGLYLGGGGGEGDSSLDGVAEAADYLFRDGAIRVVVLITDGAPKRVDGRMKSMEETVKHLREKKINQLHVVTLPGHKKAHEPLGEAAKGKYFDLELARKADDFDLLMSDVAKAIIVAIPEPPEGKAELSPAAPPPTLPPIGAVKFPTLPPGAEPDEPRFEELVPAVVPEEIPTAVEKPVEVSALRRAFAVVAWASVIVLLVPLCVFVGQLRFLPGERSSVGACALGYGGGIGVGLCVGVLACLVFGTVAAFGVRLSSATLFGLCVGLAIPLAERLLRAQEPAVESSQQERQTEQAREKKADLPLTESKVSEQKVESPIATAAPVAVKPNITAPKPADGCPGCGRMIPGAVGERYCMLCDKTF